jgi:hypothetical protein
MIWSFHDDTDGNSSHFSTLRTETEMVLETFFFFAIQPFDAAGSPRRFLLKTNNYMHWQTNPYLLMLSFWVVTPCGRVGRYQRFGGTYCLYFQGRRVWGSMLLWNVGIYLQVHTTLQPRRPTSAPSRPWELQIPQPLFGLGQIKQMQWWKYVVMVDLLKFRKQ